MLYILIQSMENENIYYVDSRCSIGYVCKCCFFLENNLYDQTSMRTHRKQVKMTILFFFYQRCNKLMKKKSTIQLISNWTIIFTICPKNLVEIREYCMSESLFCFILFLLIYKSLFSSGRCVIPKKKETMEGWVVKGKKWQIKSNKGIPFSVVNLRVDKMKIANLSSDEYV